MKLIIDTYYDCIFFFLRNLNIQSPICIIKIQYLSIFKINLYVSIKSYDLFLIFK